MNDLTTVPLVAKQLSISKKRVYQLVQEGRLESLRLSPRTLRITRSSVDRFINDRVAEEKRELGLDLGTLPPRARVSGL